MSTVSLRVSRMYPELSDLMVPVADFSSVTFDEDVVSTLESNPLVGNVEVDSEVHTQ